MPRVSVTYTTRLASVNSPAVRTGWPPPISRRLEAVFVAIITLLAFALRAVGHWQAPRGWREDELSNALVVSQHVLDGEVRLYYDDASGHEGLYHWLQAGTMAAFGSGVWGVRGVSILLGTLSVLLTYLFTRRLFDWPTAAIAALAAAVSFWSLMYSRSGQRHISMLATTLTGFFFLWKALPVADDAEGANADRSLGISRAQVSTFALAGVWMGIGFYTYFAARGVPLIVAAWGVYLLIWRPDLWRRAWRGLLLALIVAGGLAAPLAVTLGRQPGAETRIAELAGPVYDARDGDFSTLGQYTVTTLSMFTHDGDDEALYNVPHRPVFGLVGGALFWVGVALSLMRAFGAARDPRHAFLLLWLGAGLAPGVLSIPAASLGHTLLAQPVAMILPSLALTGAGRWLTGSAAGGDDRQARLATGTVLAAALVFLAWEGVRGIRDYWFVWPESRFNRVLHHSDLHEAAAWLNAHPANRNVAIGGYLNERWDQQVMGLDLEGEGWQVRAFDPRSAYILVPTGGTVVIPEYLRGTWGTSAYISLEHDAPYALYRDVGFSEHLPNPPLARFDNGLTLQEAHIREGQGDLEVLTTWESERALDLPPFPLLSKPPAPGEDDTPRLAIFVQLLDQTGQRVAGADGLGVDPYTLVVGDVFVQRFEIGLEGVPPGCYRVVVGLYNPASGSRHVDELTGDDMVGLGVWERP